MNLRNLFTLNLFFAIPIGGACVLFPAFVYQLYGLTTNDAGFWASALAGGSILGFASLMWFGRSAADRPARRAIALALLFQDTIGFSASLWLQLTGPVNAFGWASLALYGFLALAYAYFLFLRPADC
jgi:hypothetical protein